MAKIEAQAQYVHCFPDRARVHDLSSHGTGSIDIRSGQDLRAVGYDVADSGGDHCSVGFERDFGRVAGAPRGDVRSAVDNIVDSANDGSCHGLTLVPVPIVRHGYFEGAVSGAIGAQVISFCAVEGRESCSLRQE